LLLLTVAECFCCRLLLKGISASASAAADVSTHVDALRAFHTRSACF